jgi:hypothetical protein
MAIASREKVWFIMFIVGFFLQEWNSNISD